MPIAIKRIYRSNDWQTDDNPFVGLFGVGTEINYALWLYSPSEVAGRGYTSVALILPNGGRVPFNRTSTCTQQGCVDYTDAVFESNTVPDAVFFGATISYDSSIPGWDLRLKNGTVYGFGLGAPLQWIKDRNGNEVTLTWNSGLLTHIASSDGRYVNLTYYGNVIGTISDNDGRTVGYSYCIDNMTQNFDQLIQVKDALNEATNFGWDYSTPNISGLTDPLGNVTYFTYDSSNRLSEVSTSAGLIYTQSYSTSNGQPVVVVTDASDYEHAFFFDNYDPYFNDGNPNSDGDPNGYLVSLQHPWGKTYAEYTNYDRIAGTDLINSVTEASGTSLQRETAYTYDSMGDILSVTRNSGSSPSATTSYTYDPTFNQVTSVTDPNGNTTHISYNSVGDPISVTDPIGNESTATYNAFGEALNTTDPVGNTTEFAYDAVGDLTSVTDPLRHVTSFTYDSLGRVTSTIDPLGNTTHITYDAEDDVSSVTDPLGNTTSFQYDALGRRTKITDANGHSSTSTYSGIFGTQTDCDALNNCTSYSYNTLGEIVSSEDSMGVTLDFSYDGLGRATQVSSSGSSTSTFTYDVLNRITQMTGSPLGNMSLSWDALDNLTQETQYAGNVSYAYDTAGNRTQMTVANQYTVRYFYDADNRLTNISNSLLAASIAYDADSRRTQLDLPNGVTANYVYDADSHLTSITYSGIGNLTYTYDADGRKATVSGSLATVNPPAAMSATYSANNQIATYNNKSVGIDADSHITSDPSTGDTYKWSDGALTTIRNSGNSSVANSYDELGRRDSESFVVPCSGLIPYTASFLYDGLVPVQEQYTQEVTDCATYWAPFTLDENLLTIPGSGEVLAFTDPNYDNMVPLHDALGSTVGVVASNGQVQTNYSYTPFGTPSQSGAQYYYPRMFTGDEWSDFAGISPLYYTWARFYSPELHRFISPDPLGYAGSGTNLYAYVGNDPVNATDPTGMSGVFEFLFGGMFGGDVPAGVLCSNFFVCVGAITVSAAIAGLGSLIGEKTYKALNGGGGNAPAPPQFAATGDQMSSEMSQGQNAGKPTRNDYTPPPPGLGFDPNQLITIADPPAPSGKTGQLQPGSGPSNQSSLGCKANTIWGCLLDYAHLNAGLSVAIGGCAAAGMLSGPAPSLVCLGVVGGVLGLPSIPANYLLFKHCSQEYGACGN